MTDEDAFEDIVDLLADEYAQSILRATNVEGMSADELSSHCEMSKPTVYRRLEDLRAADLVEERQRVDPDGNHAKEYYASLSDVHIGLEGGEFECNIERRELDVADHFTELFENL
ncbi:ArsR/SmtB family transcription factor [Halorientalis halophila]|uniref:ArsR/SmtB family transcription factor n=1 Tax=Halorientalis halophila TaxID=3108499 RepID=UPI00300BEF89